MRAGRWTVLLAAAALAGCSALQIDVDVYKGSLTHEKEVQSRQFAAMVMAAKPILADVRNSLNAQPMTSAPRSEASEAPSPAIDRPLPKACLDARAGLRSPNRLLDMKKAAPPPTPGSWTDLKVERRQGGVPISEQNKYSHSIEFKNDAAFYVNGLLSFYEPKACVDPVDDWDRARPNLGLIDLFNALILTDEINDQAEREAEHKEAVRQLTGSLIPFAERILFVVNNPAYEGLEKLRDQRAILQTLGNSLILHANDLRRREVHETDQAFRFDAQRRAAESATAATAPAAVLQGIANLASQHQSEAAAAAKKANDEAAAASRLVSEREAQVAAAASAASAAALALKNAPPVDLSLELALATLVTPAVIAKDIAAAEQDMAEATERVAKLGTEGTVSARAVANEVVAWAKSERTAGSPASGRQRRLAAVVKVLDAKEPLVRLQGIPPGPVATVWPQVQQALEAAFKASISTRDQLQKDAAIAEANEDRVKKAKLSANSEKKRTEDQAKSAREAAEEAVNHRRLIAAALPAALGATAGKESVHPEGLRQIVLAQLQPPAGAKEQVLQEMAAARKLVAEMPLAAGFAFRPEQYGSRPQQPATSMQVLDELISHLRTRRVAVLAEGRASDAQHLADAIEAAEQQRSDQVFLRPSADYLRNVYSSTALQAQDRPPDRNMLVDYWFRMFGRESKSKGNSEIEKLFWQNINRVTTTGGANANHVVAKDDVGNWYIKSFSVDPKEVFESAKGLALFNKGARLDTNLLRRAELRDTARNATGAERTEARADLARMDATSPAAMAFGVRAQKRFEARYLEESKETANALKARVIDLPMQDLTAGWSLHLKQDNDAHKRILEALQSAAATRQTGSLSASLVEMDGTVVRVNGGITHPSSLGKSIVNALSTLPSYRDDLVMVLGANADLKDPAQSALLEPLVAATRKVINDLIDQIAQRRRGSIESYQEGLTSIAETIR